MNAGLALCGCKADAAAFLSKGTPFTLPMPTSELVIWSAMLGGILTILSMAVFDSLRHRTRGARYNLLFVLVTGGSCVVMTGLLELLLPHWSDRSMMVLKAGLGPTAGAMAIYFLGNWLGGVWEDVWVHRITVWGGAVLLVASMLLVLLATQVLPENYRALLWLVAGVNLVPALLALVVVVRSAILGDPLAKWMSLAIVCLVLMVIGLYMKGLGVAGMGTGTQILTAVVSIAFFLIASVLGQMRYRQIRMLKRLMRLEMGAEPATGLPTGGALLAEMEHSFWRTARLHGRCSVLCLYLSHFYEMTDAHSQQTGVEILVALAARIRRAAGFRCLVGLYHPRCFVVVMGSEKGQEPMADTVAGLRKLAEMPLNVTVTADWQMKRTFVPEIGVGVITVNPSQADPLKALNQAEQIALLSVLPRANTPESELSTLPPGLG